LEKIWPGLSRGLDPKSMPHAKAKNSEILIFADGACSGNPGPGGYGAILRTNGNEMEISGSEPETTNNRMELMAVIAALESLTRPSKVKVITDSSYVVKGITEWMPNWLKNNWRNSQNKPVLNRDLWERLLNVVSKHQVTWHWIKGHDGHPENERCDRLATEAIKNKRRS